MSFTDTQKNCEARFYANWTTTPIAWQNVHYDPTANTAYVEFQVVEAESEVVALSDLLYRNIGIISINIYVPLNQGLQTAKSYADSIKTIFAGQSFNEITCRAASVTTLGEQDGWFVINVSVPFFWDST